MLYDDEAKRRAVCAHVGRCVDVDADKVERTGDDLQVFGRKLRRVGTGCGEVSVRILPFLNHSHVLRVQFSRGARCRFDVFWRLDDGDADRHILSQSDLRARLCLRPDRLHGEAMAQHRVMTRLVETARRQLQARSVEPNPVSKLDESPELVDGKKMLYSIRKMFSNVTRIIAECLRGVSRLPTATVVLQRLRQIPVVEGGKRLDVVSEQFVDEEVVKVEAFRVRRAGALGKHTRPRDREAV